MAVTIVTDSTCDIEPMKAKEMGIHIIPLKLRFGDEEFTDGVDITKEEFYQKLESSESLPTTSQIPPATFEAFFKKELEAGNQVFGIFLSAELSGTYQSATIAKGMLHSEDIFLVDSRTVTFGLGLLVREAAKLRDAGKNAAEIYASLEEMKGRLVFYGIVDTLKYLKMGGRLSGTAAIVGSILNVKPIVSIVDGKVVSVGKARGQKAAFEWVLKKVGEEKRDERYGYYFASASDRQLLEDFFAFFGSTYPVGEDFSKGEIGSIVGTYSGPRCVGVAFIRE